MNEKLNKNAKVEQLTEMFLSREEEKGFIVKDPLFIHDEPIFRYIISFRTFWSTHVYTLTKMAT